MTQHFAQGRDLSKPLIEPPPRDASLYHRLGFKSLRALIVLLFVAGAIKALVILVFVLTL